MTSPHLIGIAALLALVVGPLLLGAAGCLHARRARGGATAARGGANAARWNVKLTLVSTLLYTLAFNLTFFVQELFLVLPKALTPGLRPTLFHNNHHWDGDNALASLFQGTGALATVAVGLVCALLLRRGVRSVALRLWLIWMAYCGVLMALPQVAVGALSAGSDLGMAMTYLQLGTVAKLSAALLALALIPTAALGCRRPLLSLADDPSQLAGAAARSRFIFQVATLPALLAIALILPFRVPREWIEVVLVPAVVTVIGLAWIQAGAWRVDDVTPEGDAKAVSIVWPLLAVIVLLLVFQLVLRPGIRFY